MEQQVNITVTDTGVVYAPSTQLSFRRFEVITDFVGDEIQVFMHEWAELVKGYLPDTTSPTRTIDLAIYGRPWWQSIGMGIGIMERSRELGHEARMELRLRERNTILHETAASGLHPDAPR